MVIYQQDRRYVWLLVHNLRVLLGKIVLMNALRNVLTTNMAIKQEIEVVFPFVPALMELFGLLKSQNTYASKFANKPLMEIYMTSLTVKQFLPTVLMENMEIIALICVCPYVPKIKNILEIQVLNFVLIGAQPSLTPLSTSLPILI